MRAWPRQLWSRPSGAPVLAAQAMVVATLALASTPACRIYREPPANRDETALAGRGGEQTTAVTPRDERAATTPTPASEALNLWVLSRSKGDLVPQVAPVPEETADPATRPKAMVVVVLGFGPPEPCAERLARDAVLALDAGADPLRVAAGLLEAVRRTRWPRSEGTFSAIVRGSDGRFGGIQRAGAAALSADSLVAALSRQVLLDGSRLVPTAPAAELGQPPPMLTCSAEAHDSLEGTPGILIRTEAGFVWGALVSRDLPADAGVLSVVAQYGVSVAVGGAGGILLISDCSQPPPESIAERIYASSDWVAAAASSEAPGACRVGHALLTAERVWVQSSSPLAWAALEQEGRTTPPAPMPARAPDAGSAPTPSPKNP